MCVEHCNKLIQCDVYIYIVYIFLHILCLFSLSIPFTPCIHCICILPMRNSVSVPSLVGLGGLAVVLGVKSLRFRPRSEANNRCFFSTSMCFALPSLLPTSKYVNIVLKRGGTRNPYKGLRQPPGPGQVREPFLPWNFEGHIGWRNVLCRQAFRRFLQGPASGSLRKFPGTDSSQAFLCTWGSSGNGAPRHLSWHLGRFVPHEARQDATPGRLGASVSGPLRFPQTQLLFPINCLFSGEMDAVNISFQNDRLASPVNQGY